MDANDLMDQDLTLWSVNLSGDVTDENGDDLCLDDVESLAQRMAAQAADVLKAVIKLRKMVEIATAE